MSVRVVARVRPLQQAESTADNIVTTEVSTATIRIPNTKDDARNYSFVFNAVYDMNAPQEAIFHNEVAPTIKQLFHGTDVTIFAYGVTGTGKTHTMRGGKSMTERGVIPRLLSGIYRRGKKIEKQTSGESTVAVSMSYYEIYNDKVFDLLEPIEKRSIAGLALREHNGKTVVIGLTEQPCQNLKDFERLYDHANQNRSTSATKLNAHSSRSHAILCVKVSIISGDHKRTSTVSAIDLAGSEDNRRTENNRDRLVESASINKSLFVLAQCVEAINKKQQRVPYRESKMTRVLSLGQNRGIVLMILNLAPITSYYLDTLSSLNFANRTRKIEVKQSDPLPDIITTQPAAPRIFASATGSSIHRQPLRALHSVQNSAGAAKRKADSTGKAFAVFSDRPPTKTMTLLHGETENKTIGQVLKPKTVARPATYSRAFDCTLSTATIESLVERKVSEILASRVASDGSGQDRSEAISESLRSRLEKLEQRIEKHDDTEAEGLSFLLMAKQHQIRGETASAVRMYQLAQPFFPNNEKLTQKIVKMRAQIAEQKLGIGSLKRPRESEEYGVESSAKRAAREHFQEPTPARRPVRRDSDYRYKATDESSDDSFVIPARALKTKHAANHKQPLHAMQQSPIIWPQIATPRSQRLLQIVNSRNVNQIRALKGVGQKKAVSILEGVVSLTAAQDENDVGARDVETLEELAGLKGVTKKMVENMRLGLTA